MWHHGLEVIFEDQEGLGLPIWKSCRDSLLQGNLEDASYFVVGTKKALRLQDVERAIRKDIFEVVGARTHIILEPTRFGALSLKCHFATALTAATLDRWSVQCAIPRAAIFARAYDPEYDRWQNETLLRAYGYSGKPTDGLTLVWDPVFEEQKVDTSTHPGRWVPRKGFKEAIGHLMWLARKFWSTTGASEADVRAAFPCEATDGLLRVTLSPSPFSDANPPQEELRKILFPSR